MTSGRGFAAAQWKLPVAGLLAAGCIGVLIWRLMPSRSERTDTPKPTLVRADGTAPAPVQRRSMNVPSEGVPEDDASRSYSFDKVSGAGDVAAQMDAFVGSVTGQPSGSVALAGDVRSLIEPLNKGSRDELVAAISALGGVLQTDEAGATRTEGFFSLLTDLLRYASLDTANIEIRDPTRELTPSEGARISMNRNINADPETGVEVESVSHTIEVTPMMSFPDAAGEGAKGRLVELRLPFLAKGSKSESPDIVVLLQMREVGGARWQPAGFVVDVRNEELMKSMMKNVSVNRQGGGG